MPYTKVYLHLVWATKNRFHFLHSLEVRKQLWDHIQLNARSKNIHLVVVNGYQDHCHCLISMEPDQMISKLVNLLKGESSFWINKSGLIVNQGTKEKFEWQDDYWVESVSPDDLRNVIHYIQNQEVHHMKLTFNDELEKFFNCPGL